MKKLLPDWLVRIKPYDQMRVARSKWDSQYASGDWEYLSGVGELGHYSVIAGYCTFGRHSLPSVLDVGCGHGVLQAHLEGKYCRYLGIDVSDVAIEKARSRAGSAAAFAVANIEVFEPQEKFDLIVLNECLYYMEDPRKLLRRCGEWLNDGGRIVISMYESPRSRRTWPFVEEQLCGVDVVTVSNKRNAQSWEIRLLRRATEAAGRALNAVGGSEVMGRAWMLLAPMGAI